VCVCVCTVPPLAAKAKPKQRTTTKKKTTLSEEADKSGHAVQNRYSSNVKKKKMPLQREWTGCTSRCQLQLQAGNAYTLQQQKQWLTIRPTKYEATAKHEIKTKE
jgi:heat shock protein HslJ